MLEVDGLRFLDQFHDELAAGLDERVGRIGDRELVDGGVTHFFGGFWCFTGNLGKFCRKDLVECQFLVSVITLLCQRRFSLVSLEAST